MAYNQNIPQPNDRLKNSQADLLANFQALKQLIDINHATFGDPNEGKHKFVSFPVQGAAPAFGAGEIGLYNKLPAAPFPLTGVNELFIQKSDGTTIPFTASGQLSAGDAHGYTYLPSGLLLKWGRFSVVNPGINNLTLPLVDSGGNPIPDFTTFINAQITTIAVASTGSVRFNLYTLATRNLSVSANTSNFVGIYYFMIGT